MPLVPILSRIAAATAAAPMFLLKLRLLLNRPTPPRLTWDSTWFLLELVLPETYSSAVVELPVEIDSSVPPRLPSEASVHGPTDLLVEPTGQVIGTTATTLVVSRLMPKVEQAGTPPPVGVLTQAVNGWARPVLAMIDAASAFAAACCLAAVLVPLLAVTAVFVITKLPALLVAVTLLSVIALLLLEAPMVMVPYHSAGRPGSEKRGYLKLPTYLAWQLVSARVSHQRTRAGAG